MKFSSELVFSQGAGSSNSTFTDQGGYYIFPNGLIMQWGSVPVDDTKTVIYEECNKYTITFPVKFPNKLLSLNVSLEMHGAEPTGNVSPYIYESNTEGAWGIIDLGYYTSYTRINQTFGAEVSYFAIGY